MTLPPTFSIPGFQAAGITGGIKASGKKDLAFILADQPCNWAAMFTTNAFQAAPVLYDKALLTKTGGRNLRGVIINAGNANACTGQAGEANARQMARLAEQAAHLPPDSVLVMSTGVIGHPLPMDKLAAHIPRVTKAVSVTGFNAAAEAILTTDTHPKTAGLTRPLNGQTVYIGGIAKGSGMIHPNMATMLAVILTDARLNPTGLNTALKQAVNHSFNRLSVDGDTSTNDTVLLMASGQADQTPLKGQALTDFTAALTEVCVTLAKQIARDGEGATKLVEIQITGAHTETEAVQAAAAIATSPLSKTALFGNDPNWGRFLVAAGYSGVTITPNRTSLWLRTPAVTVQLVEAGRPLPFDPVSLSRAMEQTSDIVIQLNLGAGNARTTYWTCDLSYDYVKINADYHT